MLMRSAAELVTSSVRLSPSGPVTTRALTSVRLSSPSGSAASVEPSFPKASLSVISASEKLLVTVVILKTGTWMAGRSWRRAISCLRDRAAVPACAVRSSAVVTTGPELPSVGCGAGVWWLSAMIGSAEAVTVSLTTTVWPWELVRSTAHVR